MPRPRPQTRTSNWSKLVAAYLPVAQLTILDRLVALKRGVHGFLFCELLFCVLDLMANMSNYNSEANTDPFLSS